jgi:ProP effector
MAQQILDPVTIAFNRRQRNKSMHQRFHALLWLARTFPAVFDAKESIRPLAIGVRELILARHEEAAVVGISKSKLREAITMFTHRLDYLACLKAREMRVDLDGNPTVAVTAEEAEQASLQIKKRIERLALRSSKSDVVTNFSDGLSSAASNNKAKVKQPVVVILKQKKIKRAYDPAAVMRLKEKLGLED